MTKTERKEFDRAMSLVAIDSRYTAVTLATMFRSARVLHTKQYLQEAILNDSRIAQHLRVDGDCFVPA